MIDLALARRRVRALYRHDRRGRLIEVNQWDGGAAPRFWLMRTGEGGIVRFRHDVPDDLAARLAALCTGERLGDPPSHRPAHEARYLELLAAYAAVERVWAGPAFVFDGAPAQSGGEIVSIDETNAGLLQGGLASWRPDVGRRDPYLAIVEQGRAASLCASVRITRFVHCAGVETVPESRGRGLATRVVTAWAAAVRARGAVPFYSTSWDNLASRALARRLGLVLAGVDFHVP